MKILKLSIVSLIILLSSCAEVSKNVAKDQLLGVYQGKGTAFIQYSSLNIGVEDQTNVEKSSLKIIEDASTGIVYIKENDGESNIYIQNITLATNGSLFNIKPQKIKDNDGNIFEIDGENLFELEGINYDGMFDSDKKTLTFSYITILKTELDGTPVQIPASVTYEYQKL